MKHLLILHGALGSGAQMAPLAAALQDKFILHTPNLPGHGGSPAAAFSIEAFADAVAAYCREHQLEKVNLFGYSMGGFVGLYLAAKAPGLVEKIMTLATKFHWDVPTAQRETSLLQPEVIEEKLPQFAAVLRERHAPADWKEVLHQTAGMLTVMGNRNPLGDEVLSAISIPVLLALGDRDKMVSLDETIITRKKISGAHLAVLPDTPHPFEAVDKTLLAFFVNRFFNGG